jgi:stage II sporulation protein D
MRFLRAGVFLLLPLTLSAQIPVQRALSEALRNTPAVGVVVDVATGRRIAEVHDASLPQGAPGSILKPLFLAAALQHQEIRRDSAVFCSRNLHVTEGGRDWNLACTHPQTNRAFAAQEALAYSCNTYFAALADRLSPAQSAAILQRYGLTPAHPPQSREQNELLVLGLAGISVSPEQIAHAYRNLDNELDERALQPVRDGLKDSVTYGMAHNAAVSGTEVSGKTGTVTGGGWFAGSGVFAREKVVLVIYLPRGNGADAARLAQHFFLSQKPAPESARALSIELWASRSVKQLTATPLTGTRIPIHIEWKSMSPAKTLKLSGSFRMQTADGPEVTAAGEWTITRSRDGLRVLVTLPGESYVAAALSGEAAPDEPLASLKAMAITIRTFALQNAARHRAEGFDLCDSTHCQSLRFGNTRPEVEQAVRETAGETLWSGGQRVHVYYTQHCGGMSEAANSVWPAEQAGNKPHPDPYCLRRSSATWHARIALDQLSGIFRSQGWQTPSPIEAIRVIRQTGTGRAELLQVTGRGVPAQLSASSFHFAVGRALGWNQLRSDWYTTNVSGRDLEIQGRGYGHGVGLCQAGAFEMAAEGHSDSEILSFYFPGAVSGITPADNGWHTSAGAGWTLLTTETSSSLLAEGNAAWTKAQALFGDPTHTAHPIVQELPTTELFRQTTGEPGWMLASARGSSVFLQPGQVRRKNPGAEDLLLHEFLHVLVEQQAGKNAPIWLREGLVEILAGGNQSGPLDLPASEVDAALAHPADAAASRRAHQTAARMAARLRARYGMPAVRGFLRNGVPSDVTGTRPDNSQRSFWFLINSSAMMIRREPFSCANCCQSGD